jgi:hypothetical protein
MVSVSVSAARAGLHPQSGHEGVDELALTDQIDILLVSPAVENFVVLHAEVRGAGEHHRPFATIAHQNELGAWKVLDHGLSSSGFWPDRPGGMVKQMILTNLSN